MTLSRDAVEALRAQFSGTVLESSDLGYDAARAIHNGLIDKRPAVIANCLSTADIADAVRFARSNGLEISVRGGGHNPAGKAVTSGGLMINLAAMRGTYVDPRRRRARVQGGATWNDYNRATAQHGLASTGGVVSTTGVAGLTLGGGLGWLMGRFGMACDNLRSVELVTAEGEVLQVDDDSDPDLFWGLRGGGGNFGVAASLEFEVHPIQEVLGGLVAYRLADALRVLTPYQEITADPPDELMSVLVLAHAPDGSGNKIVAVPVCYSGEIAAGEDLRGAGATRRNTRGRHDRPNAVPGDQHHAGRWIPTRGTQLLAVGVPQGAQRRRARGAPRRVRAGAIADDEHLDRELPWCGHPRRRDGNRVRPPRAWLQPCAHRRMAGSRRRRREHRLDPWDIRGGRELHR